MNGIHEVAGSIPASSTNFLDNLAKRPIRRKADLSISRPFLGGTPALEGIGFELQLQDAPHLDIMVRAS